MTQCCKIDLEVISDPLGFNEDYKMITPNGNMTWKYIKERYDTKIYYLHRKVKGKGIKIDRLNKTIEIPASNIEEIEQDILCQRWLKQLKEHGYQLSMQIFIDS